MFVCERRLCVCISTVLCVFCFFFSSRRRHTSCALVTGVQTCALPIFHSEDFGPMSRVPSLSSPFLLGFDEIERVLDRVAKGSDGYPPYNIERRSEERRVGKEYVRTCRFRWSTYHSHNK